MECGPQQQRAERHRRSASAAHHAQRLSASFRIANVPNGFGVFEKYGDVVLRQSGWRHGTRLVAAAPDETQHEDKVAAMTLLGRRRLRDLMRKRCRLVRFARERRCKSEI